MNEEELQRLIVESVKKVLLEMGSETSATGFLSNYVAEKDKAASTNQTDREIASSKINFASSRAPEYLLYMLKTNMSDEYIRFLERNEFLSLVYSVDFKINEITAVTSREIRMRGDMVFYNDRQNNFLSKTRNHIVRNKTVIYNMVDRCFYRYYRTNTQNFRIDLDVENADPQSYNEFVALADRFYQALIQGRQNIDTMSTPTKSKLH